MKIFFYPHRSFRDRQLDTIRRWPADQVVNPELAQNRCGDQVSPSYASAPRRKSSWKQKLPLLNVKLRPRVAPSDAVIYVWGAIVATGQFIVDLDNPWSLVGYNLRAMPVYRLIIKCLLLSKRCVEIRCMSEACRLSMRELFGDQVFVKAKVYYPCIPNMVDETSVRLTAECRFLFVGTQFLIKGCPELLEAFRIVKLRIPSAQLDLVTHLPEEYASLSSQEGVRIHKANLDRSEIWSMFMRNADVLVHPSYMESFGMVVLEALSHGLAVVANDVYALREMVVDGENGYLLEPPVYYWSGVLPGPLFLNESDAGNYIRRIDKSTYVKKLADAMVAIAEDPVRLLSYRQKSCSKFTQMMGY